MRGKKVLSPEEEIEKIDSLIEEYTEKLKDLRNQRKQAEATLRQKRLAELDSLISASGKSFDEIRAFLLKESQVTEQ